MDTLLRKRKVMPRSTSIIIKMIRKSRTFHSNSLFEHINNYQSEIENKPPRSRAVEVLFEK